MRYKKPLGTIQKSILLPKLFWTFTVWINCSSDLKNFANSRPSALNFKSFSRSVEQFFLTLGQNNFGNKIPIDNPHHWHLELKINHKQTSPEFPKMCIAPMEETEKDLHGVLNITIKTEYISRSKYHRLGFMGHFLRVSQKF